MVFGAAAVVSGDAVFALKSTGRWLAVDGSTVRAFGGDHWTALEQDRLCRQGRPGRLASTVRQPANFSRATARGPVHDVVGAQRAIGGVAWLCAFLIGMAYPPGAMREPRIASRCSRELERDDGDDDAGDGGAAEPRLALVG